MIVIKFGGTSVSSKKNLDNITAILQAKQDPFVVVVSALSGVTNLLEQTIESALDGNFTDKIEDFKSTHHDFILQTLPAKQQTIALVALQKICNQLNDICKSVNTLQELSPKTKAQILSYGERLSSIIVKEYLESSNIQLQLLNSQDLIDADGDYLNAKVNTASSFAKIKQAVNNTNSITSGFIAGNSLGEVVLLGRGGSDYTATLFAAALQAKNVEIWSDVNGLRSANPTIVSSSKRIEQLTYEDAFELAYFGAKVLYPQAILPAKQNNIPIHLKNTNHPEQTGTLICDNINTQQDNIKGVSSIQNIGMITVSGIALSKQKGQARRVFQTLEENNINAILFTQSCSEQSIGIAIKEKDVNTAVKSINQTFEYEIEKGSMNPVTKTSNLCIVALVGDGMRHKIGLSGKVFGALGENGINVVAIAQGASERNISIVLEQKDEEKALNVIHERFFSGSTKKIHLFIAGIGNVGKEFLKIIYNQAESLEKSHNITLKVVAVANSKQFLIDAENGLDANQIQSINNNGTAYDSFIDFVNVCSKTNLRNSIFIDNTASETVSKHYSNFLSQSISVVACNKIACSSDYQLYSQLKQQAANYNCFFKYETAVGAALPIIKTIDDLIISGDQIHQIQAVISGSLNFIFNHYNATKPFAQIVKTAKDEGYTEPNPLIDLSGIDVMRKILILSREAGYQKEMSDIEFISFLPEDCTNPKNNDAFFDALLKNENHFKEIYQNAHQKGNKLKVVANMNQGELKVELKEIPPTSPFYNLEGKDNVVALYTQRYPTEPLVIKGAGAGASVTASGVFADLISIANR